MVLYILNLAHLLVIQRMKCEYTAVKTLYFFVTLFGITKGDMFDTLEGGRKNENECYRAEFSEDVWPCADFNNEVMKCDPLELGIVEGKDGELGLQGMIGLDAEIEDGTMMIVEIWKIMDIGKEYLYHAQGDICGSLKDTNTPWFPMVDAMKITECPIPVKQYEVKDMVINLEHTKEMLNHELCGSYLVQMSMSTSEMKKISCYELGVDISAYSCNKTED
ncbi:uncharacterized protein LOC133534681 isoform X2 [Cydia pomonella]|uniref:uncharacterized protein LOC133534681 isoform X2 n=1 Tax=Cydia pomonella TaxID=82600 RepID=UPI002ADD5230|nr:uncharacterized protein LOC133534681 isoform X2 [Cydia pomonella]